MSNPLPIDEHLDAIFAAVRDHSGAVVVAEPGAGKTTRVPSMLLDLCKVPVLCTQPRRIAARLSAKRVAEERGSRLGDEVGYEVRFDRKIGKNTQLCFVTEGIALRKWHSPRKNTKRILVLDEFHERHLDADMLLAMAAKQRKEFGQLAIVVMSATLDPKPISDFIGGVPIIESSGRNFPIDHQFDLPRDKEALEVGVSRALRHLLRDASFTGDVLVFLPGVAEIRKCQQKLAPLSGEQGLDILPLHGGLAVQEQDRALRPSPKRKIILSTNVAETSVTIPGITAVIDCGTARIARHSPWTGLSSLKVEPVSQASAKQRAGRAGRTAKGRCIHLYSDKDLHLRPAFDTPEISRSDLAACALRLAASGTSLEELSWLDKPPEQAQDAANRILHALGALDDNKLTATGERMANLPVHPRLARLLLESEKLGVPQLGATAAALLGERPLRHSQRQGLQACATSSSDVLDDLDLMREIRNGDFRSHIARAAGIDLQVAKIVDKSAGQLLRTLSRQKDDPQLGDDTKDESLLRSLLSGFPDRAGRRVSPKGQSILLCKGGAVTLSQSSAVLDAQYLLAIDVESRGNAGRQRTLVRTASAIDPAWLLESNDIHEVDDHYFESDKGRVIRRTGIFYGDIALDEERIVDPKRMNHQRARALLRIALLDGNLQKVVDVEELASYRKRQHFAASIAPNLDWPTLETGDIADAILGTSDQPTRLSDLQNSSVIDALYWALSQKQRQTLDRLAPTHIAIPGRKKVIVNYESDRPPWIESRLQDFFGATTCPAVGGGQTPLTLHLLAPNRRAVQVTNDLAGFWTRHYPDLRKQLMRRYPRHKWPENP